MKITRIFFRLIFFIVLPQYASANSKINSNSLQKSQQMIILGDSLTEGYGVAQSSAFPALLEKKISEDKLNWVLTSSGSSGSTSASALQRMKWIAKKKPDIILLLLGSNDGLRGLKVSETEKNLNAAIEWALEQKIRVILGQLYMPPNYGKKYTDDFAKIYSRVAKKNNIKLLSFLLEDVAGRPEYNLSDGIHPNEKGHQIIADNMYKELKTILK
jgi:acyl-CoA thioesterase-1